MSESMPNYLSVPPEKLGEGVTVKFRTCGDMQGVAEQRHPAHVGMALERRVRAHEVGAGDLEQRLRDVVALEP